MPREIVPIDDRHGLRFFGHAETVLPEQIPEEDLAPVRALLTSGKARHFFRAFVRDILSHNHFVKLRAEVEDVLVPLIDKYGIYGVELQKGRYRVHLKGWHQFTRIVKRPRALYNAVQRLDDPKHHGLVERKVIPRHVVFEVTDWDTLERLVENDILQLRPGTYIRTVKTNVIAAPEPRWANAKVPTKWKRPKKKES